MGSVSYGLGAELSLSRSLPAVGDDRYQIPIVTDSWIVI